MDLEKYKEAQEIEFRIKQLEFYLEHTRACLSGLPLSVKIKTTYIGHESEAFIYGVNGKQDTCNASYIFDEDKHFIIEVIEKRIQHLKEKFAAL